jgi:hypothetical protein
VSLGLNNKLSQHLYSQIHSRLAEAYKPLCKGRTTRLMIGGALNCRAQEIEARGNWGIG